MHDGLFDLPELLYLLFDRLLHIFAQKHDVLHPLVLFTVALQVPFCSALRRWCLGRLAMFLAVQAAFRQLCLCSIELPVSMKSPAKAMIISEVFTMDLLSWLIAEIPPTRYGFEINAPSPGPDRGANAVILVPRTKNEIALEALESQSSTSADRTPRRLSSQSHCSAGQILPGRRAGRWVRAIVLNRRVPAWLVSIPTVNDATTLIPSRRSDPDRADVVPPAQAIQWVALQHQSWSILRSCQLPGL